MDEALAALVRAHGLEAVRAALGRVTVSARDAGSSESRTIDLAGLLRTEGAGATRSDEPVLVRDGRGPAERFASAAPLVADLQAWLDGSRLREQAVTMVRCPPWWTPAPWTAACTGFGGWPAT
jgi:hypothetical protein